MVQYEIFFIMDLYHVILIHKRILYGMMFYLLILFDLISGLYKR